MTDRVSYVEEFDSIDDVIDLGQRALDERLRVGLAQQLQEAGLQRSPGALISLIVHRDIDDFLSDRVRVEASTFGVPLPRSCPHANHIAPHPVDGVPTSCPCGMVRRFPADPKETTDA